MSDNPNASKPSVERTIVSDKRLILPGQFDNVTKRGVQRDPKGFVTTFLGIEADAFEVIETEQLSMKTHFADSFILITTQDKKAIVHCEFQTHDSTDAPMPFRMAGYIGNGIAFHRCDIYSHVIYLHPNAGRNDPGKYVQSVPGYDIVIEYRVLRLNEMDGQTFLDANKVGLVPFAALMKPPDQVDVPAWIRRCVQTVEAGSDDESQKREALSDLAILGGLAYDSLMIRNVISEETVQESSIIQYFTEKGVKQGIEQGIEQGKRQHAIEAVGTVLEVRFQADVAEKLKPFLTAIDDLERLDQLHRVAAEASSIDEFTHALLDIGD